MVVFVVHSAAGAGRLTHAAGGSSPTPRAPAASADNRQRPPPASASSSPPPRSPPAHEVIQVGGTAPAPAVATAATPGTERQKCRGEPPRFSRRSHPCAPAGRVRAGDSRAVGCGAQRDGRRFHMGNLLKVLTYNELDQGPNFFLDFENAQPTEAETAVWNQVNAVLEEAQAVLAELQSYTGAGQEIREAIQNPGDLRLQEKAWSAVCPLVAKLKRFYEFSLRLENALRSLLEALTSPPYAPTQHLEREQALAKQFAEILHFTLSFDELKMTNPAIQNDFSYYRRTISRNRINNLQLDAESEVNNEMANRMSLFYAEATPMLKTLSNATTKFVSENKTLPIEDTTDCLSTMACVCRVMLETPEYRSRFTNTETLLFCMRVMVGVIILYDHVHPVGAFAKTSKIDMKGCIKVLKDQPSTSTEGLLNALRYTTRHLNDDTTSKQIRALLQ
ncbi:CYFIP-related Rac1 interactor A-like isoform X1 [Aptenodytes patagonicus]|uniref:CYFIP-related Rac1 interactor A-like isoform X1 n=1 Tax=Aptenodytes patagonicus TaxID=9234 RepID=UPI003FA0D860